MRATFDVKRVAVGVGARMLFYPMLVYNVVRNQFESHFHWWNKVDEHVLLGAVPFPSDVLRLKKLGVCGVVTLNESYERLVPRSLYEDVHPSEETVPLTGGNSTPVSESPRPGSAGRLFTDGPDPPISEKLSLLTGSPPVSGSRTSTDRSLLTGSEPVSECRFSPVSAGVF